MKRARLSLVYSVMATLLCGLLAFPVPLYAASFVQDELAQETPVPAAEPAQETDIVTCVDADVGADDGADDTAQDEPTHDDAPDEEDLPLPVRESPVALDEGQQAPPVVAEQASEPQQEQERPRTQDYAAEANAAESWGSHIENVAGELPLVIIVVGFDGTGADDATPYDDNYNWAYSVFEQEGGVAHYYANQSEGKFVFVPAQESSSKGTANSNAHDVENDGVIHITLPMAHGDWGGSDFDGVVEMLTQAFNAADAYIDFSAYDKDGDGVVSPTELAVGFVVAGFESAASVPPAGGEPSLWSHSWEIGPDSGRSVLTLDGVNLGQYIAIAEKMGDRSDDGYFTRQNPTALLVHELGHYIGLPDLYQTKYEPGAWNPYMVQSLSLMSEGMWNTTEGAHGVANYVPSALDIWSRYELGWADPVVVSKSGDYTVRSAASSSGSNALLIPTDNPNEYFLIENRSFEGQDAGLASAYETSGLVIWHIDSSVYDDNKESVNNASHRPGVMPVYLSYNDAGEHDLPLASDEPDTYNPFFSKSMWSRLVGAISDVLDLPVYGNTASTAGPSSRTLSGITLEFLTDAMHEMVVRIRIPGTEPDEVEPEPEPDDPIPDETPEPEPTPDDSDVDPTPTPKPEPESDENPQQNEPSREPVQPEQREPFSVVPAQTTTRVTRQAAAQRALLPATTDPSTALVWCFVAGASLLEAAYLLRRLCH